MVATKPDFQDLGILVTTQEEKHDESDAKQAAKGTPEWTEVIQNRQKRIRKWIPGAMAEKVLKRTPPDM